MGGRKGMPPERSLGAQFFQERDGMRPARLLGLLLSDLRNNVPPETAPCFIVCATPKDKRSLTSISEDEIGRRQRPDTSTFLSF
jgi:hypothetical protein